MHPRLLLFAAAFAVLGLTGCNQYSTPAIESSPPNSTAENGHDRDPATLSDQSNPTEPTETTENASGLQTVPSSSNGVR